MVPVNTGTAPGPLEFHYPVNPAGADPNPDCTKARKQLQATIHFPAEIAEWVNTNRGAALDPIKI